MRALRLAQRPDLWQVDGFLEDHDIDAVTALFLDAGWLEVSALSFGRDKAGFCAEAPADASPLLISIRERLASTLGLPSFAADTVRFRWYQQGDAHRAHTDAFITGGTVLAVSALIYLEDTEAGGETAFPDSLPAAVSVQPRRGRLVAWTNLDDAGDTDPHSRHEALAVRAGEKGSLLFFFYLPVPVVGLRLEPPAVAGS